jgi:hypothetical protein
LIGYSFQIRLLSCEILPKGFQSSRTLQQHSCVLLQNDSILLKRSWICWDDWISFSAAVTVGSGIGAEAVARENSSAELLKFGRAILKFGKAYMAAAPMATKADTDATIAGIRLDRLFSAAGCLSSCVSLFSVSACGSFSGVSATCVRLGSMKQGQSRRWMVHADGCVYRKPYPSWWRDGIA